LLHIFYEEGVIGCVLNSFGEQISEKEGVAISRLWEETDFLLGVFKKEVISRSELKS